MLLLQEIHLYAANAISLLSAKPCLHLQKFQGMTRAFAQTFLLWIGAMPTLLKQSLCALLVEWKDLSCVNSG